MLSRAEQSVVPEHKTRRPFNDETAQETWKAFLAELAVSDNLSFNFSSNAILEVLPDETLLFKLSSNLSDGAINKMKTDILEFFKERLQLDHPVLQTEVALPVEERPINTEIGSPTERLSNASSNNPALAQLIHQLGLEIS
jgi:hypothetical protein